VHIYNVFITTACVVHVSVALMLYAVLEYTFTSAITCVVVFSVGIVCTALTAAHSVHCWNVEKNNCTASDQSSVKASPAASRDASKHTTNSSDIDTAMNQLKLSTLV